METNSYFSFPDGHEAFLHRSRHGAGTLWSFPPASTAWKLVFDRQERDQILSPPALKMVPHLAPKMKTHRA